uniref:Uncharacterized protein n=1 Tax=Fibrocapsa japonica TaxID=94617 RepID=A0A7S2UW27_9STRA|mmetsp:Transcript_13833/g.20376  ORF Transcript_13833/g.20376 Transcript_13833/m.20376 type:complete len:269 (+) Transcript_13833:90-896(+)
MLQNVSVFSPVSRSGSYAPCPVNTSISPALSATSPVARSLCASGAKTPDFGSPFPESSHANRFNGYKKAISPVLQDAVPSHSSPSTWRHLQGEDVFTAQWEQEKKAYSKDAFAGSKLQNEHATVCEKGVNIYRALLKVALSPGYVTTGEKEKLKRYRTIHEISTQDHQDVLDDLKWSSEEFERGYQQLNEDLFGYELLLRKELRNGRLSSTGAMKLRYYRASAGVNMDAHLAILKNLGWTLEEFEAGVKSNTHAGKTQSLLSQCEVYT